MGIEQAEGPVERHAWLFRHAQYPGVFIGIHGYGKTLQRARKTVAQCLDPGLLARPDGQQCLSPDGFRQAFELPCLGIVEDVTYQPGDIDVATEAFKVDADVAIGRHGQQCAAVAVGEIEPDGRCVAVLCHRRLAVFAVMKADGGRIRAAVVTQQQTHDTAPGHEAQAVLLEAEPVCASRLVIRQQPVAKGQQRGMLKIDPPDVNAAGCRQPARRLAVSRRHALPLAPEPGDSSRPAKAASMASICSGLWAALTLQRNRLCTVGEAGGMTRLT